MKHAAARLVGFVTVPLGLVLATTCGGGCGSSDGIGSAVGSSGSAGQNGFGNDAGRMASSPYSIRGDAPRNAGLSSSTAEEAPP